MPHMLIIPTSGLVVASSRPLATSVVLAMRCSSASRHNHQVVERLVSCVQKPLVPSGHQWTKLAVAGTAMGFMGWVGVQSLSAIALPLPVSRGSISAILVVLLVLRAFFLFFPG